MALVWSSGYVELVAVERSDSDGAYSLVRCACESCVCLSLLVKCAMVVRYDAVESSVVACTGRDVASALLAVLMLIYLGVVASGREGPVWSVVCLFPFVHVSGGAVLLDSDWAWVRGGPGAVGTCGPMVRRLCCS